MPYRPRENASYTPQGADKQPVPLREGGKPSEGGVIAKIMDRLGDQRGNSVPSAEKAGLVLGVMAIGSAFGGLHSTLSTYEQTPSLAAASLSAPGAEKTSTDDGVIVIRRAVSGSEGGAQGELNDNSGQVVSDYPTHDGAAVDNQGNRLIPGYDQAYAPGPQTSGDFGQDPQIATQSDDSANLDPNKMYGGQNPGDTTP